MNKLIRFALLGLVIFSGACHQASSDSEVKRLLVNKYIDLNDLHFSEIEDTPNVFMMDGNRGLNWAHEAPTSIGEEIYFQGTVIGHYSDGYLCNDVYADVCDANIYKVTKNNPSTITLKKGITAPDPGKKFAIANTSNLSNLEVTGPVDKPVNTSCDVEIDDGSTVSMDLIVVNKPLNMTEDGIQVEMVVVSTPLYADNGGQLVKTAEMVPVHRFYTNRPNHIQIQLKKGKGMIVKKREGMTAAEKFVLFKK
jgi:hypothetical protein